MTKELPPEPSTEEALKALDERLSAITAKRRKSVDADAEIGANQGYQALGELIGGIVGGLGLGWVFDQFVGTQPLGIITGTLLGFVAAVYVIVKSSQKQDQKPIDPKAQDTDHKEPL